MLWFAVDRERDKPLTRQVYEQLRDRILKRELKEGERLPSTRELANAVGVSRNVVLEAYERLIAEGYAEVRPRSGTFVASGSALPGGGEAGERDRENGEARDGRPQRSEAPRPVIDFRSAHPAMDRFPRGVWGRLAKEVCLDSPDRVFGYMSAEGGAELRGVLARYLHQARGVRCRPEQIVITTGATQALYLITELLARDDAPIAVEDPVTDEMRTIFAYAGARIRPVPVDEKGIVTDLLPEDEKPAFVFVIPSHQFPLGGTLPIQRRIRLIEYARRTGCYIVEDDYDSEFTYEGVPVHSMQGLDPERVVYVGTFSKILSPALRIGYAVLPEPLVETFRSRKWFMDRHTSSLEQLVLARFMEEGHLNRHIRRMRSLYRKRREALVSRLRESFPDAVILGESAGMHLVVELPGTDMTPSLADRILAHGVAIYPVERYAIVKGAHRSRFVMGYGGVTVEAIREGVDRLKRALSSAD
ncbi:PLP-dependent aminotransferase family protein [Paenibacillus flagellatus]|uniref:GntR family transcriptional regulator n=1 Tax=Paenibacillus flagellatus TaxID=2211139 RepID=A0A2V5K1H7_9BACL|nr:PLP-dependent aminotransferase family protein [Paenibacillus flagellatus]PYI52978.1 GntR family transcriptional regulator [Paenibacillus flagellatus]